jgi:hypothetical protein
VRDFGETACFAKETCFDEPLTASDSRPASLTLIGRSTNAAIAAMMAGRRRQIAEPDRANFLSDDSNPYLPKSDFCSRFIAEQVDIIRDSEP